MEKLEPVFYKDNKGNIKLNPFALEASSDQEIVKLAYNICMALQLAHRRNVLHRDIKLENIFYSPKKKMYKLGDFGIAKVTDMGVASTIAFTGGYGAPEVRDDLKDVYDERADIYSLGMTLYLLLNGRRFPDSKTYKPNLREQYTKGFVLPYPDNGPDKMRHIIRKMCMYDPNDRYQSIKEVMDNLEKLIYSPTLSYRIQHRNLLLIIGCVCMFLGLGAAVITYMPQVYTSDSALMQQYTSYRWLAVTLLLLALFLLLQYSVILLRYMAVFNCILKWHLLEWIYMIYLVECGISGGLRNYVLTSPYSEAYIAYMYEHNDPRRIEFILTMDFFNIAVAMFVFGAIWCIREKILIHIEDARQEDGIL